MRIETERLLITDFRADMAEAVHRNSLDEDNRRFVPDEVFETVEEAREVVTFLMGRYGGTEGPFVHPILLKSGENIGYVQLVKLPDWTGLIEKPRAGHGEKDGALPDPRHMPGGEPRLRPGDGKVRLPTFVQGRRPLSGRGTGDHQKRMVPCSPSLAR